MPPDGREVYGIRWCPDRSRKRRSGVGEGSAMDEMSVRSLLDHYNVLLELYERLGVVSERIFQALGTGAQIGDISSHLKENAETAELIRIESEAIVGMKRELAETSTLTDRERRLVHNAEKRLSQIVENVMTCESNNRAVLSKQGIRVTRR